MKVSTVLQMICALILTWGATTTAQTLIDSDVKPPYVSLLCGRNEGNLGTLDVTVTYLNVTENADQLILQVRSDLKICTVDTSENFFWKEADPYAGFDVQYFNDVTNAIATRKAYIDPAKPYNRVALSAYDDSENGNGSAWSGPMQSAEGNKLSGTVTLKKSELFGRKELAQLARGETVIKTIALFHLANLTNEVDGTDLQLGDQGLGGRNILLKFKQSNSK